ncbi:MFS transporter [uncultured Nitratireductor sp.]|uniref:MFS transporter n=1 Tax=uncultured Nitratireductor sp. TaxID=520953 RepID=UPI0025E797A9|nr:MFS transporter [uncultured Nitratireductor sp.]
MPSRLLLPVLALAVFFVGATEFMIAPLLTPIGAAFDAAPAEAAWLISGYALAYAFGAPLIGLAAHRLDRRRLLLAALTLLAADGLAVVFAPTLGVAIVLRIFGGAAAAALIPAVFALIADRLPEARHSQAMGFVMLGMTAGIASGPALAGLLAQFFDWRAPFIASAVGCILLLFPASGALTVEATPPSSSAPPAFNGFGRKLLLLLVAKALWNGAAVAAFGLSGEMLRHRFEVDTLQTGLSTAAFGIGLAVGNLSTGLFKRVFGSDERLLIIAVFMLALSFAAFLFLPLPLSGALTCLAGWGVALGFAAPASTALIARRADKGKAFALALSESANNLALLAILSLAALAFETSSLIAAGAVLATGLAFGIGLFLLDALVQQKAKTHDDGSCEMPSQR